MLKINYWAVIVAAVAAIVVSSVWYSPLLFGKAWIELRGMNPGAMAGMRPPAGEILGEAVKTLVVAFVIAHFVVSLGVGDWKGAVLLGVWLWLGFYATLMGSVIHENYPWKLYAVHAGDGLARTLLMTVILGVWRR
jgi:uncharacterized protein DUF1761